MGKIQRILNKIERIRAKYFLIISDLCYHTRVGFYWALAGVIAAAVLVLTSLDMSFFGSEASTFDSMIKMRWSSPVPSKQIVILDVDEKSLAKLAPKFGRWPWKREVLAEAVSELEGAGAKSILFNVLITDPDINDKQSDAILDSVAQESKVIAFPFVRLPTENDDKSALQVSQITGAKQVSEENPTVAAILPGMLGMRKSMGVSNLDGDEDGVLRTYVLERKEALWSMPTLVGEAIALAEGKPKVVSDKPYSLNWRNKKGSYERISFVDYYASLQGAGGVQASYFKDKYVILGASAPGIAALKVTPANTLTDDNEILATALDDALNNTHLRLIPSWILAALAVIFVLTLAFLFHIRNSDLADHIFLGIEFGSVGIMFLAISYTNFYIDLAPLATYGIAFYTIAKMHSNLSDRVIKGSPEHLSTLSARKPKLLGVMVFKDEDVLRTQLVTAYPKLVKIFGLKSVFLCSDIFGEDTILGNLQDLGCLIVVSKDADEKSFREELKKLPFDLDVQEMKIYGLPQDESNLEAVIGFISQRILEELSKLEL